MSKLILQPSGNAGARKHYVDTIENPVEILKIRPYLTQETFNILSQIYPDGLCYVWGVTPGGNNVTKWNRIERGDITLFSKNGGIFASGVTTFKIHNHQLASELWGFDDKGQTWEYIYFLAEIRALNIPYIEFNRTVIKANGQPYADNFIIQGFSVLYEFQGTNFLERYDLSSEIFIEEVNNDKFIRIIQALENLENTEEDIKSKRRLEQAYLKDYLFQRNIFAKCACCHKTFPVSFLVTAHIKKRAYCTSEEKRDMRIVMPMCKFGCDELFEQGYIYVRQGIFQRLNKKITSANLIDILSQVDGNLCDYYNEHTKYYFEWHHKYHTSSL